MFLPGRGVVRVSDPSSSAGSSQYANNTEINALIAAFNVNSRFGEGTVSAVANMLLTVIVSSTMVSFLSPCLPPLPSRSWPLSAAQAVTGPMTHPMLFSLSMRPGAELATCALCNVVYG